MKKSLFSLLFLMMFICFQTLAQDTKSKSLSGDNDRTATEITVVGNKIYTENAPIGKRIEIFSVVGLRVHEIEIKTPTTEYILPIPKGYYILRVPGTETVKKIAIR